jgi:hypothetical protein
MNSSTLSVLSKKKFIDFFITAESAAMTKRVE